MAQQIGQLAGQTLIHNIQHIKNRIAIHASLLGVINGEVFYPENFEVKLLRPSSTATDDECLHEITFANEFQKIIIFAYILNYEKNT